MLLITSAAYVDQELKSIFGKLIPAFLPVKNKRLFFHQVNKFHFETEKYLSVPENYNIEKIDLELINRLNINIIKVPNGLTLGESVLFCINWIGKYYEKLTILHGDTLIDSPPVSGDDFYSISKISDYYDWAYNEELGSQNYTYTGLFRFSDICLLAKSLLENKNNFIDGIEDYRKKSGKVRLIMTDSWFDFGHTNTFFRSRSQLTTERIFNKLYCDSTVIKKTSHQKGKIKAEAMWFKSIPDRLKVYTPHCFSYEETELSASYSLEYLHQPVLSELFIFGNVPVYIWEYILDKCMLYLEELHKFPCKIDISKQCQGLIILKTLDRLQQFSSEYDLDIDREWIFNGQKTPSLRKIAIETSQGISFDDRSFQTVIHGDFCFSNILYNFISQNIKVIDPRGLDVNGEMTIYGDIRYDIAKLAHSILGLYDFIIADYYNLNIIEENNIEFEILTKENTKLIQNYFLKMSFGNSRLIELDIIQMTIHLFLSMLPLHSENKTRQLALVANILRLYNEYK